MYMKKTVFFISVLLVSLFISCKSTEVIEDDEELEDGKVITYVNTAVNRADGKISTVLTFKDVTEVIAIHPNSRERFNIDRKNFNYDPDTTRLNITLPGECRYKLVELTFHIVGEALNPGVFVLAGIDSSRGNPGVFIKGKLAADGKEYSYDKAAGRITSIIPLNVDKGSFEICWATKNGVVSFSNNTEKYKDEYRQLFNDWSRSINRP